MNSLSYFIVWFFTVYKWILIFYIFSSWFPKYRNSRLVSFLRAVSEPYLAIFSSFIPRVGIFDLSPILALFVLHFVQKGFIVLLNWIISFFV